MTRIQKDILIAEGDLLLKAQDAKNNPPPPKKPIGKELTLNKLSALNSEVEKLHGERNHLRREIGCFPPKPEMNRMEKMLSKVENRLRKLYPLATAAYHNFNRAIAAQ